MFQVGKTGVGYLLNAHRLGGVGHPLDRVSVCAGAYGALAYADGRMFVPCRDGFVALQLAAPDRAEVVWRSRGWDAGPPVVGGGAVFAVDEGQGLLRVLAAASGREIARWSLGPVPPFDAPTLAAGRVLVPAGERIVALRLLTRAPSPASLSARRRG